MKTNKQSSKSKAVTTKEWLLERLSIKKFIPETIWFYKHSTNLHVKRVPFSKINQSKRK